MERYILPVKAATALIVHAQAALTSRRGAAFGFASIAKLAGEQLGPHVAALVPKLYRQAPLRLANLPVTGRDGLLRPKMLTLC